MLMRSRFPNNLFYPYPKYVTIENGTIVRTERLRYLCVREIHLWMHFLEFLQRLNNVK